MNIRVFIQNETGSNLKHYHDEKTLEWKRAVKSIATVSVSCTVSLLEPRPKMDATSTASY